MSLAETFRKDMFEATRNHDINKVDILKLSLASIKNVEVEKGEPLDDSEIVNVLRKEVKKIKDSIEQYEKMGREDLLQKEKSQLEVLNSYLPQLMTEEEVKVVVSKKIKELGVSDIKDMGKVIGAVMKELNGKTDGSVVKDAVQSLLS